MAEIVRKYRASLQIRLLAMQLVRPLRERDLVTEAATIMQYVQHSIRYLRDIRGVETLQSPIKTLQLGQGDCDDKSMLASALLESIGFQTRFVAVGPIQGVFSHVYIEVLINGSWVAMELIYPYPLGRAPAGMLSRMERAV